VNGAPPIAFSAPAGDGEAIWSLGTLLLVRASGEQTGGAFSLFEVTLPRGASPPLHSHPQDESFYVLEGELTLSLEGKQTTLKPGSFAFIPRSLPHTFRVESETAVTLTLSTPAGIENFLRDVGAPAERPTLPPADARRPSDEERRAAEQASDLQVHGPPLGPAD
jgi:quercetin dioxygenase-like cupin family protein